MPRSPPWTHMHLIWHSRRGHRRNHLRQIFWWSVEGCRFCGGSKIALSHWQSQWPLTQGWRYRAACDCDHQRVCMFVCLSACIPNKPHFHILPKFLYMLSVTPARLCSDSNAMCYVLPVLWMMSCFHIMQAIVQNQHDAYVSSSLPGRVVAAEVKFPLCSSPIFGDNGSVFYVTRPALSKH